MKETGILYSTEMVRAKLEDRKSMTRRTRGLEEINEHPDYWEFIRMEGCLGVFYNKTLGSHEIFKCPYGQPGDLHWVRETWNFLYRHKDSDQLCTKNDFVRIQNPEQWHPFRYVFAADNNGDNEPPSWKPSIHMPKSAARIWDEVVSVRAERLQDISPNDACNEGVEYWNIDYDALEGGELQADFKNYTWRDDENYEDYHFPTFANSVDSFRSLWQSINGEESWNHNPWVWVIGTKNISKTGRP